MEKAHRHFNHGGPNACSQISTDFINIIALSMILHQKKSWLAAIAIMSEEIERERERERGRWRSHFPCRLRRFSELPALLANQNAACCCIAYSTSIMYIPKMQRLVSNWSSQGRSFGFFKVTLETPHFNVNAVLQFVVRKEKSRFLKWNCV